MALTMTNGDIKRAIDWAYKTGLISKRDEEPALQEAQRKRSRASYVNRRDKILVARKARYAASKAAAANKETK